MTANDDELLDVDNMELMSEHDSQGSDQKPISWIQNLYDIWKFIGVICYHFTLTLLVAYYINSNFASQYIKDIFWMFLIVRPSLIAFYSVFVTCMDAHKTYVRRKKYVYQKELDELNFENLQELKKNAKAMIRHDTAQSLEDDKMEAKNAARKNLNAEDGDLREILEAQGLDLPEDLQHIYQESEDEDEDAKENDKGPRNYLKEIEFEFPELASYSELFW